mgnify:FL=1
MKNIILLLALFPLFLSCTDDDKEEVKHDYFTDFVTGVTVGGDLRPTSIRIDNEMNKISIDFHVIVSYGVSISAVSDNLIESVKYRVEEFTGMEVEKINIFVEGVRVID